MSILAREPIARYDRHAVRRDAAFQPQVVEPTPLRDRSDVESDVTERIDRSIAYMCAHLQEPLQVSKLAALAHSSQSHYFALFKRCTQLTPIDYFIRLRMRRAAELLESSTDCVKEIAGSLGYEDPFYFSRVFKSVHGVAPTDYRRQIQSESTDHVDYQMVATGLPHHREPVNSREECRVAGDPHPAQPKFTAQHEML